MNTPMHKIILDIIARAISIIAQINLDSPIRIYTQGWYIISHTHAHTF